MRTTAQRQLANGIGTHAVTDEASDRPAEEDGMLPRTTYTPLAVAQQRDTHDVTTTNENGADHATEELSGISLQADRPSVVSTDQRVSEDDTAGPSPDTQR
jgi:hypothetical protein